jgi:hypothetical protein
MAPLGSHATAMKNESFNLTHLQSMREKAAKNQKNSENTKIANPIPNIPAVIYLVSIDAPASANTYGTRVDFQIQGANFVGFLFFQRQLLR